MAILLNLVKFEFLNKNTGDIDTDEDRLASHQRSEIVDSNMLCCKHANGKGLCKVIFSL